MLAAAIDRLPEGIINEGEVIDVDALALALKNFWKTYKLKARKVSLGLASQKVVVRTLDFPLLDEKELRSAIEFQAQDYIPIPIEEAVFDFHIMGRFTDEDGIEKQKVLVVAAQLNMVMDFINAAKKANLTIDGIDLQAFAMLRTYSPRSFLDQGTPAGQAVAIVNIASDVTNLVIEANGEPQFTRITSFGGDDFTRAVQEQLGVSFSEADIMKSQIGLPEPGNLHGGGHPSGGEPPQGTGYGDEDAAGGPSETVWPEVPGDEQSRINAAVQRALEIITDSLADELRRSLDYYVSQEESLPVGKMLLGGGGALLPNLVTHLSQIFPFDVELGNPLVRIVGNRSDLTDEELSALGPRLAIAIGLALEDEQ